VDLDGHPVVALLFNVGHQIRCLSILGS
jgi:hypothetical protein